MRGRLDLDKHKFAALFARQSPKRSWKKRARTQKMPGGMKGQYFMLWRIVDGAVRDTFARHPDYLTDKGRWNARISLNKRITGALVGYATQVARSRSVAHVAHAAGERTVTVRGSCRRPTLRSIYAVWAQNIKALRLWWDKQSSHPKFNGDTS